MHEYTFKDELVQVWCYKDRLMIYLLHHYLKPTFQCIISKMCVSTRGPCAIKEVTLDIKRALKSSKYHYALRIDDAGGTIATLDEVSNAFLAGYNPSEYNQTLIRDFVLKVAYGRDSRAGKLLAEDKEGFVKQFGEEVMSKKIYQ